MAERFSTRDALLGTAQNATDGRKGYIQQVEIVEGSGGSGPATGTLTSVDSAAVSTTILAANSARQGATITNTDANVLYLDLSGGTASATSYSVAIAASGYFSVPHGYTGLITGIWAVDGSGAALVTEFT